MMSQHGDHVLAAGADHHPETGVQGVADPTKRRKLVRHVKVPSPRGVGLSVDWGAQTVEQLIGGPLCYGALGHRVGGRSHKDRFRTFIISFSWRVCL